MQEKKRGKMQKLVTFLERNDISYAVFAELVGTSPSTLCDIINKKRNPSLELAWAIENKTYGFVKMKDWISPQYLVTNKHKKNNKKKESEAD